MAERITGHTELIGLMAYPIRHSSSPAMHNEAFATLGLDYAYLAFEVDNSTLEDAIKGLRALKMVGSNVSMPNKTVVGQYLDELSPAAEMCGAVNTIVNDNGKLIGLAACSADCDDMWQIGIDVLPEYRRQGIASSLTSNLAMEIMDRGKVPFYCCAWSNLKSVKNALRSGFVPGWVEMTVKDAGFVENMNK